MSTGQQIDALWNGLRDNNGQPLAGGKVHTYVAGTNTPSALYTDAAKTTPATNPVVLDAHGRALVFGDGSYKFVVMNSSDVTLYTIDNLYYSNRSPDLTDIVNEIGYAQQMNYTGDGDIITNAIRYESGAKQIQQYSSGTWGALPFNFPSPVGIGTTTPGFALDVSVNNTSQDVDTIRLTNTNASGQSVISASINGIIRGRLRYDSVGNANYVCVGGDHRFYTGGDFGGGAERLRINAAGNIGINNQSPSNALDVGCLNWDTGITIRMPSGGFRPKMSFNVGTTESAYIYLDNGGFGTGTNNALACVSGSNGVFLAPAGTSWSAISDIRFKKNIKPLEYGLKQIQELHTIRFDYDDEASNNSARIGFIAQNVAQVIPEAVTGSTETKLGVAKDEIIAALVNAVKELSKRVEALEAK